MTNEDCIARYDGVIHLTTLADGFPKKYEKEKMGNPARWEDAKTAIEWDKKLLSAWEKHPQHSIIPCVRSKEAKMKNVMKAIQDVLHTGTNAVLTSKLSLQ